MNERRSFRAIAAGTVLAQVICESPHTIGIVPHSIESPEGTPVLPTRQTRALNTIARMDLSDLRGFGEALSYFLVTKREFDGLNVLHT